VVFGKWYTNFVNGAQIWQNSALLFGKTMQFQSEKMLVKLNGKYSTVLQQLFARHTKFGEIDP